MPANLGTDPAIRNLETFLVLLSSQTWFTIRIHMLSTSRTARTLQEGEVTWDSLRWCWSQKEHTSSYGPRYTYKPSPTTWYMVKPAAA